MDTLGRLKDVGLDYESKKYVISFELDDISADELERLFSDARLGYLDIQVHRHRNKRSLDSNAYMWAVISRIAVALSSTRQEVYEEMLNRYGIVDADAPVITIAANVPIEALGGHWIKLRDSKDGKFKAYRQIRGTSEYDSKEMSYFVDKVVDEAKELGVELPPLSDNDEG